MFDVEKEIRDDLRSTLVSNHTAESGTTTTNIKITAHGLDNGTNIINTSRGNAKRAITVVDADNFTVDSITGQTTGDTIQVLAFKHYYVGQVDEFPTTYLPCVVVFGSTSTLEQKSTATDRWRFDLNIEVYSNAWANVSENELSDDILAAQRELKDLMEKRQSNGAPETNTILGVVRKYILGTNYLYNDNIEITYGKHLINNKPYFKASMKLQCVTMAHPRT